MNHTFLLTLAILGPILLFILLIVLNVKRKARKRRERILQLFRQLARDHQLCPTTEHILPSRMLAIDHINKAIVFISGNEELQHEVIRMHNVTDCQVVETGRRIVSADKNRQSEEHISRIELCFLRSNEEAILIPIYEEEYDGVYEKAACMEVAQSWRGQIKAMLFDAL